MNTVTVTENDTPLTVQQDIQELGVTEVVQRVEINDRDGLCVSETSQSVSVSEKSGDALTVIERKNSLSIAEAAIINQYGGAGGGQLQLDHFEPTGPTDTTFNLSADPVGDIKLFFNGLLQDPTDYTATSTQVIYTGSIALEAGDSIIAVYGIAGSGSGTPSDPVSGSYFGVSGVNVTSITYVDGGDADEAYETMTFANGTVLTFTYTSGNPNPDLNGLPATVTNGSDKTATFTYDSEGRYATVTYT